MDPIIARVAEALYAANPDLQPWDGDPFGFQEAIRRGEWRVKVAIEQAKLLRDLGFVDVPAVRGNAINMWELRREHKLR